MAEIYLDTCVWARPFDEPAEEIIQEEEALYKILVKANEGKLKILGSVVLDYEVSRISDEVKREDIRRTIDLFESAKILEIPQDIRREILGMGLKPMDASHLAIAVSNSEYFITVDKEILYKREKIEKKYKVKVMNPVEFVEVIE